MAKKLTVASLNDRLVTVKGGRNKAVRAGGTPIVVLHKQETKLAWWRPGPHWWSLPTWRVFQRTKHGVMVRQPCVLDVLGKA